MKTISICKFMLLYYGVPLTAGAKYSHEQIKKKFNLETYSFDYISKNMEKITEGTAIYVEDSYGEVLPYKVESKIFTCDEECKYMEPEDDRVTEEEIIEVKKLLKKLSELPPVQLKEILKRYKGIDSICRLVIKELRRRGISRPAKYQKKRLLYQAKGMENPDKYEKRIEIAYKKIK